MDGGTHDLLPCVPASLRLDRSCLAHRRGCRATRATGVTDYAGDRPLRPGLAIRGEKRGSGSAAPRARPATWSPSTGPCLSRWPESPATSTTLPMSQVAARAGDRRRRNDPVVAIEVDGQSAPDDHRLEAMAVDGGDAVGGIAVVDPRRKVAGVIGLARRGRRDHDHVLTDDVEQGAERATEEVPHPGAARADDGVGGDGSPHRAGALVGVGAQEAATQLAAAQAELIDHRVEGAPCMRWSSWS